MFVVAIMQVSAVSSITICGGGARHVLLVGPRLGRPPRLGHRRRGGFRRAGLLWTSATLGTLGVTSLLLDARGLLGRPVRRDHGAWAPAGPALRPSPRSAFVALGGYALHSLLGEPCTGPRVSPRRAASGRATNGSSSPTPVFALVRRLVGAARARRAAARGRARCLTPRTASGATRRPGFLPPDPSVERAVPAHAGARASGSASSAIVALGRLRAALLPALVAAGALGRRATSTRPRTTSSARSGSRRRAARSSTGTAR